MKNIKKDNLPFVVILLIVLGVLSRTIFHLGPNIEFVTAASLLSASYLGLRWALLVPFVIMFISDIIIGNTNVFIFTWSAYLIVGFTAYAGFTSKKGQNVHKKAQNRIIKSVFFAVGASVWFYLWTNFGVWLLDSFGMYPKTIPGLIQAYVLGLPFLKYNLLGNLLFVPLAFTIFETNKSIGLVISKTIKRFKLYI